jgi:hypothetical protein
MYKKYIHAPAMNTTVTTNTAARESDGERFLVRDLHWVQDLPRVMAEHLLMLLTASPRGQVPYRVRPAPRKVYLETVRP